MTLIRILNLTHQEPNPNPNPNPNPTLTLILILNLTHQEAVITSGLFHFTPEDKQTLIEACKNAETDLAEEERSPSGSLNKKEWDIAWSKCPLDGLRDQIWNATPGNPMKIEDLIKVLVANIMINDADFDFFVAQSKESQEIDGEAAKDGEINEGEWRVIWSKAELAHLRDAIWNIIPGDLITQASLSSALSSE